jgi:hypothetical protein
MSDESVPAWAQILVLSVAYLRATHAPTTWRGWTGCRMT